MNKILSPIILIISVFHLSAFCQIKVQMTREDGVYTVPCKVNGLPLKFIFDTGASEISMSLTEAKFMLKNGLLSKGDIIGSSYAQIANGDIIRNTKVVLRTVEIGGLKIYNVRASIIHGLEAPLLLGQSALEQLGGYQIVGGTLTILGKTAKSINSAPSSSNKIKYKESEVYTVVDQQPEFPDGIAGLGRFLQANLKYPVEAQKANIEGRVFISFVVDIDGSIQDVQVLKGLGFGTDEEATRVVRDMPKWKPGKQSGRVVRVKYNLPINFSLE